MLQEKHKLMHSVVIKHAIENKYKESRGSVSLWSDCKKIKENVSYRGKKNRKRVLNSLIIGY